MIENLQILIFINCFDFIQLKTWFKSSNQFKILISVLETLKILILINYFDFIELKTWKMFLINKIILI